MESTSEMTPIGPEAFQVMRQFFEYDKGIPLNVQLIERVDKPAYIREKIVFTGTRFSRVPGYLAIPKNGSDSHPCVIQIHGLTSSKESWWDENGSMNQLTRQLLEAGFAVLSLDAEYHGERVAKNDYESPTGLLDKGWFVSMRDMMIQTTIEYRRAIDYLESRSDIDTSKIGIIGYSMGGIMIFHLSAVDPRVKVSVAAVTPIITVPYLATSVYNFAPYINKPFLMLMGTKDIRNYTQTSAQWLLELIPGKTRNLIFFDSEHMLPVEWTNRATEWMEKYLK
jgi:dienelactone hydrolase